jgi:transcriptional regulator of acetoin/glycerol metabolism
VFRPPSPSPVAYQPEAIWSARRAFFDEGRHTEGLIEHAVFRSWVRCTDSGHRANEPVEFAPVSRGHLQTLLAQNQSLLDAAQP